MKILVIGGSGFLGLKVSLYLAKKGHMVFIFDQKKNKLNHKTIKFIKGDIRNQRSLSKAIKGMDIVYNFAAIADIEKANKDVQETAIINTLSNIKIIKLCKKFNIKRFILASTIYVHSSQGGYYRVSKQAAELFIDEFCKQNNLNYTILRYGSVYGPGAGVNNGINKIIYNAKKNKKLEYGGSKKAQRKFIHIDDTARLSAEILNRKYINQNILITGNKNYKVKKILNYIASKMNLKKRINFKKKKGSAHYDIHPYNYYPKKDHEIKGKRISLNSYLDKIL